MRPGSLDSLRWLRTGSLTVSRAHVIDAAHWPNDDAALAERLKDARRSGRFPRRAGVVAWALQQPAAPSDAAAIGLLQPLREAGFNVDAVLTVPQALALLAQQVARDDGPAGAGTVWLALSQRGAAIAIVRGRDFLYSRTIDWTCPIGSGANDGLLERDSCVAHIAPEVIHGIAMVRSGYGIDVDRAITCGDLPDLRSLTMPLAEELDIDVQTFDASMEPDVAAGAETPALGDRAPALMLACSAAAAAPARPGAERSAGILRAAAALAGVGALAWWTYLLYAPLRRPERTATPSAAQTRPPSTAPRTPWRPPSTFAKAPAVAEGRPADRSSSSGGRSGGSAAAGGRPAAPAPAAAPGPPAVPRQAARRAPALRPMNPLNEPLPAVNSILVGADRRIAVLDGRIVEEGDAVGPRVLLRIEPDAVILREPSGHEVRVPVRRGPAADGAPTGVQRPRAGGAGPISRVRRLIKSPHPS